MTELNNKTSIFIGKQGERNARTFTLDFSLWVQKFGEGTIMAFHKRSHDEIPYPVVVSVEGNTLTWSPLETDTAQIGYGALEVEYYVNDVRAISQRWATVVKSSLTGITSDIPEPYQPWVDRIAELETMRDEAKGYSEQAEGFKNDTEALKNHVSETVAQFDVNVEQKTTEFNQNAESKLNAYNQNDAQKVEAYNENAISVMKAFTIGATSLKNAYDQNALDKTNAFNQKVEQKTSQFDSNALQKTTDFNENADEKIREFDERVELNKFPNVTIVGSPTISHGNISGFSSANYCRFPFMVDFRGKPFEITFDIVTGANVSNQQNILDSDFGLAFAIRSGHFVIAISTNGTSWDLGEGVGTMTVQPSTEYRIVIGWNGSVYTVKVSTDGGTSFTTDIAKSGTVQPYPRQIFIGVGENFGTVSNWFTGIINLNYASLYIDGQLAWLGIDVVGLNTRADVSLSNLDEDGVEVINNLIDAKTSPLSESITDISTSLYNEADDGNFFDKSRCLIRKDINSSTGKIVDNPNYAVSPIIKMDFNRPIIYSGGNGAYAYCYDSNHNYLGRLGQLFDYERVLASSFPEIAYIRTVTSIELIDNKMILYNDVPHKDGYIPYNPIGKWIEESEEIERLHKEIEVFTNLSDDGNFYNKDTSMHNATINSSTGVIGKGAEVVSEKIVMPSYEKRVLLTGADNGYLYCYDSDGNYLGRYDSLDTGDTPKIRYPNVSYLRIRIAESSDKVMVAYETSGTNYKEYNPIGGFIEKYNEYHPTMLRVFNYNTGDFTGEGLVRESKEAEIAYRQVIGDGEGNICCYQYDKWGNPKNPVDNIFATCRNRFATDLGDYNHHAICSDYDIIDSGVVTYTGSENLTHKMFNWVKVKIDGKDVVIVNMHVEWRDNSQRYGQISDIINFVANHENVIVCGDFNPEDYVNGVRQSRNLTFEYDLNRFNEVGFTPANAGYFGVIDTLCSENTLDTNRPFDNILVKGNIIIKGFGLVKRDWMDDHFPVYADVCVF